MSELHRERVLALKGEGKTFVQIAAEVGLTKGQVAGIVWRATSHLYPYSRREKSSAERLARVIKAYAKRYGTDAACDVFEQALCGDAVDQAEAA